MNPIIKLIKYKYAYATDMKQHRSNNKIKKLIGLIKFIQNNKIIFDNANLNDEIAAALQFKNTLSKLKININETYIYPLDLNVIRYVHFDRYQIASLTADYEWMLLHPLKDKLEEVQGMLDGSFKDSLLITLDAIKSLINRIISILNISKDPRHLELSRYFERIWTHPCETYDEALQRILFFNALFWQNKHRQNGIGRLDLWLDKFYKDDLKNGIISPKIAKNLLKIFIQILGKDYKAKSNSEFPGDSGQVIIIGGIDQNNLNVENEITHLLLDIFKEFPIPDPKLILRVNKKTSNIIWEKAIESILKGSGSPLIMNEEVIIPKMVKFGYSISDVWNMGTSACWEPLIIGKSFDQNNCFPNIPILLALTTTLYKKNITNFEQLLSNLEKEIHELILNWELSIRFDVSPLLSLFFDDCIKKNCDITQGGARYEYHGLLIVGLPNLINAILNLKTFIFEKNLINLKTCINCLEKNYEGYDDIMQLFKNNDKCFGSDNPEVIQLTNRIMTCIGNAVSEKKFLSRKLKVGFSSPGFVGLAKQFPASLDGRKKGDPFAVHISPISSDIDIFSILDFASQLNYDDTKINGNVVDFIIPSSFIEQKSKLISIIKGAFDKGVYEMQLNVLNKQTLINAKNNPELYPNLIVRVWGFSAYFKDLPEDYKDNLIKRAEIYNAN